jgi:hypothetical protein
LPDNTVTSTLGVTLFQNRRPCRIIQVQGVRLLPTNYSQWWLFDPEGGDGSHPLFFVVAIRGETVGSIDS